MGETATDVRCHPWNTSFAWEPHTGPFRVLTEQQAAQFDDQGFVVLEDVFDAGFIAGLRDEIDGLEAETDRFLRAQEGERAYIAERGALTFTVHIVRRSSVAREFVTHPVFTGLCADLVGPDANLYWDQSVYKHPEKPRHFPWHQDNGYAYVEPQQYLTCWVALTDATTENGCPRVAPGLHRRGTLHHRFVQPLGFECLPVAEAGVAAPVRAGGMVVLSSLTPHLTGPNLTGDVRKAYIVQYVAAGAEVLHGDPESGPPTHRVPCDHSARQFPVLRRGEPVVTRRGSPGGPEPDRRR